MKTNSVSELVAVLASGNTRTIERTKNQSYKAVSEKIDGKETGFLTLKAVGGNLALLVAENDLLQTVQKFLTRKGFNTFGDENLIRFGNVFSVVKNDVIQRDDSKLDSIIAELEKLEIDLSKLNSKVQKYLLSIDSPVVPTNRQALEILCAACFPRIETAKREIKQALETDKEYEQNRINNFNNNVKQSRLDALTALKKAETEKAKKVAK